MFPNMNEYMRNKYGKFEEIEVTEEEFVKLMVESGVTEEKAKFQANMCKMLGSSILVEKRRLSIKKEEKDENV
jgi:hypothetical protein